MLFLRAVGDKRNARREPGVSYATMCFGDLLLELVLYVQKAMKMTRLETRRNKHIRDDIDRETPYYREHRCHIGRTDIAGHFRRT